MTNCSGEIEEWMWITSSADLSEKPLTIYGRVKAFPNASTSRHGGLEN